MARNYAIRVYLDKEQEVIIKKAASEEGYKSLSSFMRDLVLTKNVLFKEKFFEIHRKVMDNDK